MMNLIVPMEVVGESFHRHTLILLLHICCGRAQEGRQGFLAPCCYTIVITAISPHWHHIISISLHVPRHKKNHKHANTLLTHTRRGRERGGTTPEPPPPPFYGEGGHAFSRPPFCRLTPTPAPSAHSLSHSEKAVNAVTGKCYIIFQVVKRNHQ